MTRLLCAALSVCLIGTGTAHAAGTTLVYAIEPSERAGQPSVDVAKVVAMVEHRLEAMKIKNVEVKPRGKDQLTLEFSQTDEKELVRVRQSLSHPGQLEFRILADRRSADDEKAIELAEAQSKDKEQTKVHDANGKIVAEWVRLPMRELHLEPKSCVLRNVAEGKQDVLARIDPWNVTGIYLTKVATSYGAGGVSLSIKLNNRGGELFGQLTSANLPRPNGVASKLAIILDQEVITQATIQSKITSDAQISGRFTETEVADLAATLDTGTLPAKLRLISEEKQSR